MKRILSLWLTVAIVLVPWVAFGQESEPPPPSQMFDRLADTYAALMGMLDREEVDPEAERPAVRVYEMRPSATVVVSDSPAAPDAATANAGEVRASSRRSFARWPISLAAAAVDSR